MSDKIKFHRLQEAVREKYNEQKEAAKAMGFKDSSPLTILLQRDPKKVRSDSYKRIIKAFPEYNIKWFRGESDDKWLSRDKENTTLASSNQNIKPDSVRPVPYDDYMMVEYEDLATAAGYLGVDESTLSLLPGTKKRLVPKEFERGKYLVVKVDGHSMDNGTSISIPDGTEILIKELTINNGESLPIRNNLFVIVSKDGVVLKQITEHNLEEGFIRCHSYNPKFKDYSIRLSDILQIFIYRKIVSSRPHIPDIEK